MEFTIRKSPMIILSKLSLVCCLKCVILKTKPLKNAWKIYRKNLCITFLYIAFSIGKYANVLKNQFLK